MIIGNQKQIRFLEKMRSSGNLPHALLFSGEEGLGKKTIALRFIAEIFQSPIFAHPDFLFIKPDSSRQILIDQIRKVRRRLSLSSFSAPLVAVLIDDAHLMNIQAQNALLKTLEEPKGRALIILISSQPSNLLPTILSRCQEIKFYPLSKKEVVSYLKQKNLSPEKIKKIEKISLGRAGVIINLLEKKGLLEEIEEEGKNFLNLEGASLFKKFSFAEKKSKEEKIKEKVFYWILALREKLFSREDKLSRGVIQELEILEEGYHLLERTNANQRLILEKLVFDI